MRNMDFNDIMQQFFHSRMETELNHEPEDKYKQAADKLESHKEKIKALVHLPEDEKFTLFFELSELIGAELAACGDAHYKLGFTDGARLIMGALTGWK